MPCPAPNAILFPIEDCADIRLARSYFEKGRCLIRSPSTAIDLVGSDQDLSVLSNYNLDVSNSVQIEQHFFLNFFIV